MNTCVASPAYVALLARVSPKVIRSEEEDERSIEALYELEQHQESWG